MTGAQHSTSTEELLVAQQALRDAEDGQVRTDEIVSSMLGWAGRIAVMHEENHYVNKLRTIFRGDHNA